MNNLPFREIRVKPQWILDEMERIAVSDADPFSFRLKFEGLQDILQGRPTTWRGIPCTLLEVTDEP